MANPFFKFKKFTVYHDKCAMKVGTDGVLLGAWTNVIKAERILDIGTGSGLIAMMLAQRNKDTMIDAIDIEEGAFIQAIENIAASPFRERIAVHLAPLTEYAESISCKYDLIVSNPPYFGQSLTSPDEHRTIARHTTTLTLDALLSDSLSILNSEGRIALILPSSKEKELKAAAEVYSLTIQRKTNVVPTPNAIHKRILIELTRKENAKKCTTNNLLLEISRHQYSPEYKSLTSEFYL
jgi:Predicted O-methyltransferase